MLIIIVIILPVLLLLWFYFSESSKTRQNESRSPMEENIENRNQLLPPQITVVFQKDIANEEELIKEIADMYISNRTYYYSGKQLPSELLSEKRELDFVKYESIDFTALKKIDV